MRRFFILVLFFLSVLLNITCESKRKLECKSIDEISSTIKNELLAEEVTIEYHILQEEIYFPKLRCIKVVIKNPITKSVNFKKINTSPDDWKYDEVHNQLKDEGLKYANMIAMNCNLSNVDDIIFSYGKENEKYSFFPWFTIHYEEIVKNERSSEVKINKE